MQEKAKVLCSFVNSPQKYKYIIAKMIKSVCRFLSLFVWNDNKTFIMLSSIPTTTTTTAATTTSSTTIPRRDDTSVSWESKECTIESIIRYVPNGSSVYIGSAAATPETILNALVHNWDTTDIQIIQMLPGGNLPHLHENMDRFRTVSFHSYSKTLYYDKDKFGSNEEDDNNGTNEPDNKTATTTRTSSHHYSIGKEGLADYKPMNASSITRLLREKIITVDIAIIKVTVPHKGFCSLGVGVDCSFEFIQNAKIVIAEIASNMPWTEGPTKISTNLIHYWVPNSDPLKTTNELWPLYMNNVSNKYKQPNSVMESIGKNILKEIPNGATLKFDWNPIVYSVIPYLHERCDLGLHTDVLVQGLYELHEQGIINNRLKNINTGTSVVSQAHGNNLDFYHFLDRNPAIEIHPCSYVNNPQVLSQINQLIVLIGALKVDVTGQVTTDSIGFKFYGGLWSTDNSMNGVKLSPNGKPLVILPSKSAHGRSNIVFALPPGTGISITRSNVEYVITEYGTAYLYGKSIRERCLALIEIAHPDFRSELFSLAKQYQYISQSQPGKSFRSAYPKQYECYYTITTTTTTKKQVRGDHQQKLFIRPIKPIDEDLLRAFFHKLSDHNVYLRYFRKLRSMSHQILQKYTDLDYSHDMALLALRPLMNSNISNSNTHVGESNLVTSCRQQQYEIVGIVQIISSYHGDLPEIAFQVRDDWQGVGLGTYLFTRIIEVCLSPTFHCPQVKADVLSENKAMRKVFEKSNVPYKIRCDFGVITYTFDLLSSKQCSL